MVREILTKRKPYADFCYFENLDFRLDLKGFKTRESLTLYTNSVKSFHL